jgi:hypothetical protein
MTYRKANRDNSAPENGPDNGDRHTKAGDDQARAVGRREQNPPAPIKRLFIGAFVCD